MRFRWLVYFALFVAVIFSSAYFYRNLQLSAGRTAYENHNYVLAMEKLSPFSGWHDSRAETELGVIYFNGYGIPENDKLAFNFFEKSASSGFAHGEYLLGLMYDQGDSVPANSYKAVYWYQKAANQGDAEAEYLLGLHYTSGNGVSIDLAQAANWYSKAADQGEVNAQNNLGVAYKEGAGVPQDYAKAAGWFQKVADQDDPSGENNLGSAYQDGQGLPQDYTKAAYWYQQAVDHGMAVAEYNLGILYQNGQGVPQDDSKAISLLQKSADQGYADGQFELGAAYINGEGVAVDQAEAADLFLKSAMQGDAAAEDALGQLYEGGFTDKSGDMIPDNKVLAYMLFDVSAAQGFSPAENAKDNLAKYLIPEQIASGQKMTAEWQVGSPLPSKPSYEDLAPQILFDDYGNSPAETYQNSRIWFSRLFATKNGPRYVVFIVTTGDDYHAARANIGEVTFDPTAEWENLYNEQAQRNFTQMGSFGDVPPLDDPNATYASPKRINVIVYNLNHNRVAFLIPDSYSGSGEQSSGYEVFVFDGNANYQSGQWKDLGGIENSDDWGGCTGNSPSLGNVPCYSWKGTVQMLPAEGNAWPEFVVHAQGTALDSNNNIIPAPEMIYQYNGQNYIQVQPKRINP